MKGNYISYFRSLQWEVSYDISIKKIGHCAKGPVGKTTDEKEKEFSFLKKKY